MRVGGLLVGLLALLAAAGSIANAVVRSEANGMARFSERIWPNHPATLRSTGMAQIGQAAARGELPATQTMQKMRRLAARAPLQPEPFLVEAALAAKRGESERGAQLLLEARRRDPRSAAARYLLADHYIRTGAIVEGLRELTVLSRLLPGSAVQLVPGLAAYARTPGAIPKLRELFRESPDLEQLLLTTLASDAANADLVLAVARPASISAPGTWRARLLKSLVEAGRYEKAYQVWARFTGAQGRPTGLFRPDFAPTPEPPPFNWTLAKSGGGLAEPSNAGLRVLHYGRAATTLASQVMLLPAGRYEIAFAVAGDVGGEGQLRWRVACLPSGPLVLDLALTSAAGGRAGGQFQVPSNGCAAQRIELVGAAADMPKSSDATISQLRLSRVGA
ncbi:MAG: hypothetical protein M3438_05645 [Pseudomonadota bacterium]|nr:hypothetical protein [Pseudomonadota bacterium]